MVKGDSLLPSEAAPWGRRTDAEIQATQRDLQRYKVERTNNDKFQSANFRRMSEQIQQLSQTVSLLELTVQTLLDLAEVRQAEDTVGFDGFTGWYTGDLPEVMIESSTGRLEIGYGGTANLGDAYFCYSVYSEEDGVIVDRDDVQANPAQRVAVTGGVSFAPSGWRTAIINVPPNKYLRVRLEVYSGYIDTTIWGAAIQARVSL